MAVVDVETAIADAWKRESAAIVGALVRMTRDLSIAEEIAHDALVKALETWPTEGVPDNPGAWLMTTAKRRAINVMKRGAMWSAKRAQVQHELEREENSVDAVDESVVRDDVLRLVFVACHPLLSREARTSLTLRVVGGLSTTEIARAFLLDESAIAQRIVRAKKTLADAGVQLEMPAVDEIAARLESVLEVVYLVFNEGYSATAGDDLLRPALVDEAIRLAKLIVRIAPAEPEVHALSALLQLQSSRDRARVDAAGEPVLLADQNRSLWDRARIESGLAALATADALTERRGAYHLQAAIAACHAQAASVDDTDWSRIASLYTELNRVTPSPVIELNRAIAVSRAEGPAAGLKLLDDLARHRALAEYHWLPAARADLLERLGKTKEARKEFERAAKLATHDKQRARLLERAKRLAD